MENVTESAETVSVPVTVSETVIETPVTEKATVRKLFGTALDKDIASMSLTISLRRIAPFRPILSLRTPKLSAF